MHQLLEIVRSRAAATWRYRWYAVAAAWVIGIAGWTAVSMMPDRYRATARVYVDTQSILRPLLAGLAMQPNTSQIVEMMSRTLISRPNLDRLIAMAKLEEGEAKSGRAHEETLTRLGRDLMITSTGAQNFYAITYTDSDRQQALRVVSSLLTIFEQGLGDKRKDSDSARDFIDEQLKVYSERLVAAENAVTEFKRQNMGLMPGQGQTYFTRLAEAKTALSQARLELAEAEQGRDAVKRRFSSSEAPPSLIEERVAETGVAPIEISTNVELESRITALQQKLDNLRLTYTERHPDIAGLVSAIDQLKAQQQREREQKLREARAKKPATATATAAARPQTQDPVYAQLTMSMAEYEASVASLQTRVREYERRYNELRAAANAVPQVEAAYTQLTRDYETIKKNYDQLATRRESAQLTGDVQSNANVMEFRVIDPPQVPVRPDWPNRPLLLSAVLFMAIFGGIAIAFAISQLRPTIDTEHALRELSGLAVFGTVGMAWNGEEERKKHRGFVALFICSVGLLVVYFAVMAPPVIKQISHIGFWTGK
jgi:polysaccharide chain length determinant protein (PEP-CTERM system associated)